jgi:hypothetical protein
MIAESEPVKIRATTKLVNGLDGPAVAQANGGAAETYSSRILHECHVGVFCECASKDDVSVVSFGLTDGAKIPKTMIGYTKQLRAMESTSAGLDRGNCQRSATMPFDSLYVSLKTVCNEQGLAFRTTETAVGEVDAFSSGCDSCFRKSV